MQIVFQDPFGSLSPRMSVGQIVDEGLTLHRLGGDREGRRRAGRRRSLEEVGLDPASQDRYPHEFSGGQRQRIAIARAMVLEPRFVVLDEPTSALDMSVQAQIVDLLRDLQARHGLAYLFISHDLRVVRALSDEVIVMRDGQVVEQGAAGEIFDQPQAPLHPGADGRRLRHRGGRDRARRNLTCSRCTSRSTRAGSIVVLTGAGISVESGLPSFRGADGLWQGWRLEEVATPEAFARQPATVQRFYDQRRRQLLGAGIQPNAAHQALARLEKHWPGEVLVVTQNIDDLHERAGTGNLIHMHGELLKARCTACAALHAWRHDLEPRSPLRRPAARRTSCARTSSGSARCRSSSRRSTPRSRAATCSWRSARRARSIRPPASSRRRGRHGRAHTIELNLEPSAVSSLFAEHRHGPASATVPRLVEEHPGPLSSADADRRARRSAPSARRRPRSGAAPSSPRTACRRRSRAPGRRTWLEAALLGRRAVPFREAVAAEAGEVHQVDVLDLGVRAQMLDQGAERRRLELGPGALVQSGDIGHVAPSG